MALHRWIFPALALLAALSHTPTAEASRDPAYLKGYADALLAHVLQLPTLRAEVKNGVAIIEDSLSAAVQKRIRSSLLKIDGIENVKFTTEAKFAKTAAAVVAENTPAAKKKKWTRRLLFRPPIADPRAPRFSAGWQNYLGNNSLTNVGAVSFGETLTLADITGDDPNRDDLDEGNFELNFQGAVFSIFDMDGTSKDLVNSDFWAAITESYRRRYEGGDSSAMLRLFHQSSHLGDEYILFNAISERDRVNVSYEGLDLTVAWEPRDADKFTGLRLYGGGSVLLRREPTTLDRWSAKVGAEKVWDQVNWPGVRIPGTAWPKNGFRFYPVAAGHFQAYGQNDWQPDVSLAAGMQFRNSEDDDRQVRLLVSYFNGYSPNGQFYDEQLEYVSFGGQYQF